MTKKPKKEKWKTRDCTFDKTRYVVDQDDKLIADCYADCSIGLGLPGPVEYRNNARRIAMLPDMARALEKAEAHLGYGSPAHCVVSDLLDKYNRLRPK